MKILITGMNRAQCTEDNYKTQQLKLPIHASMLACLRDMGHEVEQRLVNIGEKLDHYDKVIVLLHNPGTFSYACFNGWYAVSQRPDAILGFDDWQTDALWNSNFSSATADDSRIYRQYVLDNVGKNIGDHFEENKPLIRKGLQSIASKTHKILVPAFKGGDLSSLIPGGYPSELMFSYNPNPYNKNVKHFVDPKDKKREFNFASLMQDKTQKWLKKNGPTTWPINFYGSRKHKQVRLTEDEICKVFAEQWASLLPGYWHENSGWWRFRHLQVADAGSILVGNPKELEIIYKDKDLASVKATDVEQMDLSQLTALAEAQREAIYAAHPLDKAVQRAEFTKVLES